MKDKIKFSVDQLVSTSQLVQSQAKYFEQALDYPLFIQRNHEVKWVLLSLEDYERIVEERGKKK